MIIDVALPQRRYQVFTYRVPHHLQSRLRIGSRVIVPFGHVKLEGVVSRFPQNLSSERFDRARSLNVLREIAELLDSPSEVPLPQILFELANQIADYYLAPPESSLRLVLPPASVNRISKRIVLTDSGRKAPNLSKLTTAQRKILSRLQQSPKGITLSTLQKVVKDAGKVVGSWKRRGWLVERQSVQNVSDTKSKQVAHSLKSSIKDPSGCEHKNNLPVVLYTQVGGQQSQIPTPAWLPQWWDDFTHKLTAQRYEDLLLNVPDAFRLTYLLRAVQETCSLQRSVLVLAPEITKAQEIFTACLAHRGARVALFHSDLSQRVRKQLWEQIRDGMFDVVVGTRSVLFVPLPSVGMVWVEHEEDTSYKEEQSPYYHARDVARMRARLENALLIFGSSHPSVETFHQLSNRYSSARLPTVTKPTASPIIQIVNLQQTPYGTVLSESMIEGMQKALDSKGKVILYLNRKGFSRALTCRDCGYVPLCTSCRVTLTVFKKPSSLLCSHCGQSQPIPTTCPSCSSFRLQSIGFGTERLEECIRQQFPSAHVARFDGESVKTREDEQSIFRLFQQGNIHVLIGTELLIHRRGIPRASFIGVPYADAGLHNPDFRASERTYHLLSKVLQLRDTDRDYSKVIIQTHLPTHHVMCSLAQRDPSIFYDQELSIRQALDYPPFSNLIQIALSGKEQEFVQKMSHIVGAMLRQRVTSFSTRNDVRKGLGESLLGPIPALRSRYRRTYRWLILIKSHDLTRDRRIVREAQQELEGRLKKGRLAFEVNVDPLEIQ